MITVSTRGLYKISLTLKCVTWKAGCWTKQKNGTFLIPEVPDQGDYFTGFLKRGGAWGEETTWSFFFFLLAHFMLVFQLLFPSTPSPRQSHHPLRTRSFSLPRPSLCRRISAFHQQKLAVLSRGPSIPPAVSAPSAQELLFHPVTEKNGCPQTRKKSPLFYRGLLL